MQNNLVRPFVFIPAAILLIGTKSVRSADSVPDELVVSGYRQDRSFELDTSITVLDKETIRQASVANFEDLVQLVPNMYFSGEGSRARYFQIRGVGEREQYEGAPNPSVGYIVDDIDLSGIGGINSTFDLAQSDILRGPQSARYGGSALAGIVYSQSEEPGDELKGRFEFTSGTADAYAAGAALGGPLGPDLGGRISVHHYADNGFRRNSFLGVDDTNRRRETTVRGRLRWQIGQAWTMSLAGLYANFNNGYDAWSLSNSDVTLSDRSTPAIAPSDAPAESPAYNDLGNDTQRTFGGSLRLEGPLSEDVDIVSISTLATTDINFNYDADWASPQTFQPDYQVAYGSYNPRDRDAFSQEFRLLSGQSARLFNDSTDWVLGVYYQKLSERNSLRNPGEYVDFNDPFCNALGVCTSLRAVDSDYRADTLATFAAVESQLNDGWSMSFGVRIERWEAQYQDAWFDNGIFNTSSGAPVAGDYQLDADDNMLGGHISFAYDWSDELRMHARVARGFKAGGFNPSLNAIGGNGVAGQYGSDLVYYRPEYMWSYELGMKGLWRQGDLRADITFFYMDRDNAQLSQSDQLRDDPETPELEGDPAAFVFVTYNGAARSYGFEASASWQLSAAWEIFGSVGLLNTEVLDWPVRDAVERRDLAHAPPYTISVGVSWKNMAGWFARLDVNAVGAYYFDISHDEKSAAYEKFDLLLGREWPAWSLSVWARNVFDAEYATRGFFFVNEPPYTQSPTLYTRFGQPRQVGFTARYRY